MFSSAPMAAKKTAKTKKKGATPKKAEAPQAAPAPKKGRGGPRGPRAGSKTSFILGQPPEMLAKDVVAAGAKAGLEFSDKFVWSVRSSAKSKGSTGAAPAAKTAKVVPAKRGPGRPRKEAASSNVRATGAGREDQLFGLVLEVGIARAEEIVARAREQINGLRL